MIMLAIFFYVSCWFCRLNFSVCHLLRFLLLLSKSYYFLCVPALIWVITNSLFYPQRARLGQASSKSLAGYAQAFPCWHCTCVAHSRDKQHWQNLGMPPEALVFQTGVQAAAPWNTTVHLNKAEHSALTQGPTHQVWNGSLPKS